MRLAPLREYMKEVSSCTEKYMTPCRVPWRRLKSRPQGREADHVKEPWRWLKRRATQLAPKRKKNYAKRRLRDSTPGRRDESQGRPEEDTKPGDPGKERQKQYT